MPPLWTSSSFHASKSRVEQDGRGSGQAGGGRLEEGGSSQGRDGSNTGQKPGRWAPARGGKRPRCQAQGPRLTSTHSQLWQKHQRTRAVGASPGVGKSPGRTWRKGGRQEDAVLLRSSPRRKLPLIISGLSSPRGPPQQTATALCRCPQRGGWKRDKGVAGQEAGEWPAGGQVLAGMEHRAWERSKVIESYHILSAGPSTHHRLSY